MKIILSIILFAFFSSNAFAHTRQGMTHVVDIIENFEGEWRMNLRKIDVDDYRDDAKFQSKKSTDLKLLVVNKAGQQLEEHFLIYKPAAGFGVDSSQKKKSKRSFVAVKGSTFLFLKKSKAAYEVKLFHKDKMVASDKFDD